MSKLMIFMKLSPIAALILLPASALHATSVNPFTDLGSAGPSNWQILAVNTGSSTANLNIAYSSQVDGNVGVANGNVRVSSSSAIYGNLDVGTSGTISNSGIVSGSINQNSATNTLLANATTAAMKAFTDASGMTATITSVTTINNPSSATTITGTSGINVIDLTNLDLSGSGDGLTLSAPSNGYFVINISGAFSVGNQANIVVAGGLSAADVLYNVTGTSGTVQFNGASGNVDVQGIVLAPYQDININGAQVDGEVITGNLTITQVNTATVDLPEPATLTFLATGLAGLGFRRWRRR
jgi:choice-of-anchor A domain-containing protein